MMDSKDWRPTKRYLGDGVYAVQVAPWCPEFDDKRGGP